MQCNWSVALAAPDNRPLKRKLKIVGRPEREHLRVHRRVQIISAAQLPTGKVYAGYMRGNIRNVQWINPINPERINVLGVIRPGHRASIPLTPATHRLTIGNASASTCRTRGLTQRNGFRSERTPTGEWKWCGSGNDLLPERITASRAQSSIPPKRSMFVLAPHIQRKWPPLFCRRSTGNRVQPGLIRPSIILAEGRSHVIAVSQNRSPDPHKPRIGRVSPYTRPRSARPSGISTLN